MGLKLKGAALEDKGHLLSAGLVAGVDPRVESSDDSDAEEVEVGTRNSNGPAFVFGFELVPVLNVDIASTISKLKLLEVFRL